MGPLSRLLLLGSTVGVLSFAQAPAKLAPFEKDILDTESAWSKLASTLEARMARLAPCDASAARLIDETKKASDARIDAIGRYYRALQSNAAASSDAIRALVDEQRGRSSADAQERNDTEQERSAVEARLVNLEASTQQKPALGVARTQLQQIEALIRDRAALNSSQIANRADALAVLQDLLTTSQNRELAISKEATVLTEESNGWNGYYAARTARSRTECQAIGGSAAPPPVQPAKPPAGKSK